jgi:serine/threonine-protein kinase RsbW
MPTLQAQERSVLNRQDLVNLALTGQLDVATLPQFEQALNRLRSGGQTKVIVDLSGLEYISSSGLGAFLGMVDHFRKAGGDLAFVRLSEKVQKIFKVVGFNRLLTILGNEDDAVRHFGHPLSVLSQFLITAATSNPHSGEAFDLEVLAADSRGMPLDSFNEEVSLRPSTGIASPAKIGPFAKGVWRGKVVLTGPGIVSLRAVQGEAQGEASFDVVETKDPAQLPVVVKCTGCGTPTEIRAFNVYRCRDCDEIYFVDKWAHAISLKAGSRGAPLPPKRIKLDLPADVNLLAASRVFLTALLREHGVPAEAVNDVELATDEAVTNVIEHAYQYDTRRSVSIEILLEKSQLRVLIRDNGEPFTPSQQPKVDLDKHIAERRTGGLGVHLMHQLMDKVEHRREGQENVLELLKRWGPA